MTLLIELLSNGGITIPIIVLTVFEMAGLWLYQRMASRGPGLKVVLPNILAGDFLLAAWFANATHQAWPVIALALLLAFICHAADMVLRWR